ncbi:RGS domain-containing protein [Syncephalis plumigaleata]|nr:RGS domain-containing protein [Syncephalis plumigaleata]
MSASPSIRRQVEEIQPLGNWLAFYLVAVHLMTVISPTAVVWVFTYLLKDTTSEDEFMDVLHRPSEFQKFCKYAIGEFSVENPLFYDRCRSIMEDGHHGRRHCSTQTREELRKIYDAFLQPNAPLEINLPYHLRKAIDEQVNGNKWSTKMFEEARWEVWRLMYQHTYPRYIRSGNSKRK